MATKVKHAQINCFMGIWSFKLLHSKCDNFGWTAGSCYRVTVKQQQRREHFVRLVEVVLGRKNVCKATITLKGLIEIVTLIIVVVCEQLACGRGQLE